MTLTLYRAGGLTPLEQIPVKKPWFDDASTGFILPHHSPRSSSVFASRTYEEACQWVDWRHDMGMDGDIWEIIINDLSSPIFAHYCHYYETAGFCRSMPDYAIEGEFEKSIAEYWSTGIDIRSYPCPGSTEDGYMEVLLPYAAAVKARWNLIQLMEPPVWEDEPTYFDTNPSLVN